MRKDILIVGNAHVGEVQSINKDLIEKALHMRCSSYLSKVKSQLLTETIFEIDNSKKDLSKINEKIASQRDTVAKQKLELEKAHEQLQKEISERKQVEIERSKLESQLLHSQKMESLGTLAGGIAHEFNNILTFTQGYTELLIKKHPAGSEDRLYLDQIYKGGKRAVNLVRQILIFSNFDSSQIKPVNLYNVVNEGLNMVKAGMPENVEIQQDLLEDSPYIMADATQIHQMILNLCINAYQAMKGNPGILKVALDRLEKSPQGLCVGSRACLKITVEDNGCGIPKKDQRRIFDPFFTTKEVGEGVGLGLAVVHGIVEKHQGIITIESKVSKGTTVSVFLPIIKADNNGDQSNLSIPEN